MNDETQAEHLEAMMHNYLNASKYELALPLVKIKQSALKRLSVNDIVLLEMDQLSLVLIKENRVCAELEMNTDFSGYKAEITKLIHSSIDTLKESKYHTLKISCGEFRIKRLKMGCQIALHETDIETFSLYVNEKEVAEGHLVNVDDQIAIKIEKVMSNG